MKTEKLSLAPASQEDFGHPDSVGDRNNRQSRESHLWGSFGRFGEFCFDVKDNNNGRGMGRTRMFLFCAEAEGRHYTSVRLEEDSQREKTTRQAAVHMGILHNRLHFSVNLKLFYICP